METDVLVVGGGLGGVAAALAALGAGRRVILTEEYDWLGGQLTSQAVPPDEHTWVERFGVTASYRELRDGIRAFYRKHFPLTERARTWRELNPGAGWVSPLCHEPRVAPIVYLSSPEKFTLPQALTQYVDSYGGPMWNVQLAAASLTAIPVIIVFVIAQRQFIEGLSHTGLK